MHVNTFKLNEIDGKYVGAHFKIKVLDKTVLFECSRAADEKMRGRFTIK